jgi:sRNA-binding protein
MYGQALAQGLEGEVVTKQGLYKMTVDWLRVNLVDNPESYFTDPSSQQAQQAAQAKQQQAAQQAQQTADQASQIAALPEQIAAEKDKYKSDQEVAFKYFDSVLSAMTEQSKAESQGVIDFANARAEAETIQRTNAGSAGGAKTGNGPGGTQRGGGSSVAAKRSGNNPKKS